MKRWLPLAVIVSALLAPPASAVPVTAFSTGADLVGGTLTVTFLFSGSFTFPIAPGAPGEGQVFVPGIVAFSVLGDTESTTWSMTNLTETDLLMSSVFNLNFPGLISLFDASVPNPGTFDSGPGLSGILVVGGPAVAISAVESVPWGDPDNAGDMFLVETINWNGFVPGATALWLDDTDAEFDIPEPSAAWLIGSGLAALLVLAIRRAGS